MDQVLQQSPQNIDKATIEAIFIKNNENVLDTLFELWEIDDNKNSDTDISDIVSSSIEIVDIKKDINENKKWSNIRDICDSFDIEMQKVMKK
uniref:Uncharacterized protein n=1 Tax=viral metagenome TaxID=1070528 RepID=A0A6C0J3D3_9ZZZZ